MAGFRGAGGRRAALAKGLDSNSWGLGLEVRSTVCNCTFYKRLLHNACLAVKGVGIGIKADQVQGEVLRRCV